MKKEKFKYDVAFSFLAEDEQEATKIDDLLKNRLNTFLYSKKQEEIAGTDGEETFHNVFGKESRIVVVLYRKNWGSTPWTRIEETAIKNRAFDAGYDFAIFIPLDTPKEMPKWMPKTQIWIGLERWGIEGAAIVIESRVQEAGGEPHEESIQDRMAKIERERDFHEKRENFLFSKAGVDKADQEIKTLFSTVKENAESVSFRVVEEPIKTWLRRILNISSRGYRVVLHWQIRHENSLNGSALIVTVSNKSILTMPSCQIAIPPTELSREVFIFDIDINENPCWKSEYSGKDFSTQKLAKYCIELLIEGIEEDLTQK